MDFEQNKKENKNKQNYHLENLKIVREFSKELIQEMRNLVKAVVLFGSNTKDTLNKNSDIDLMIVLDNVSVYVTEELREAYKIITNKIVAKTSDKLHIMTVNYSDYWDMARKADPVLVNILREGLPIYDTGIIDSMQYLLEIGKIKPSRETVINYMNRSQTLINETHRHLIDSILDMYYSIVDIVHSTLMIEKQTPPSPKHMPELFDKITQGKNINKFSEDIKLFYDISKQIEHKTLKNIDGKLYDKLIKKADKIINELTKYNNSKLKKTNIFEL